MHKMYIDTVTGTYGDARDIVIFDADVEAQLSDPDADHSLVEGWLAEMGDTEITDFAEEVTPVTLTGKEQHGNLSTD